MAEWWPSGGRVVDECWTSGGRGADKWWNRGQSVVEEWPASGRRVGEWPISERQVVNSHGRTAARKLGTAGVVAASITSSSSPSSSPLPKSAANSDMVSIGRSLGVEKCNTQSERGLRGAALRNTGKACDAQIRVFARTSAPQASVGSISKGIRIGASGTAFSALKLLFGFVGVNWHDTPRVRIAVSRRALWARRISTNLQPTYPHSAQAVPPAPHTEKAMLQARAIATG